MGAVGNLMVYFGANTQGLKKGAKDSQNIINDVVNKISSLKTELASIGAVAIPINSVRNWAAAVNDLEDKTGMAAESASRLLAVGEVFGVVTDDMANAIMKMSKTAYSAAEAQEKAAEAGTISTDVFTKFGIAIKDNNGNLLSAEQILGNVADKHRNMADGVTKNAMEMEIFGKSGGKFNDLLNQSSDRLAEVAEQAQKTGLVLDHDTTQAFEDADLKIRESEQALKGLTVQIGAEMLPTFEKLADATKSVSQWFAELEPDTRKNITTILELSAAVSALSLGYKGLMYISTPLIDAIAKITGAMKLLELQSIKTWAAMLSPAGIAVAVVAAAAYKLYSDYDHYSNGAFTFPQ